MVTINKVFDIPKAKGRGEFKVVHATFADADLPSKYVTGGFEISFTDVRNVVVPISANLQSGGFLLQPESYSGKAVNYLAYWGSDSGTVNEVASGEGLSGAVTVDAVAICEAE